MKSSQQISMLEESSKLRWFKISVHKRDFNYYIGTDCMAGMPQDLLMVVSNCSQFSPTPLNSQCLHKDEVRHFEILI